MHKKSWSDLSRTQQVGLVVGGLIEVALTGAALYDLAHRPAAEIRGPKAGWALACFIQPVGPLLYLTAGRR